ncbi:MAG: glycoside hydrolase, partial [Verrucomicrobiales bacterium]|nr:glycoside hydrolase [Verrucomicrobiales bacterium]
DEQPVGTCNALATPHEYDLGRLSVGRHTLTVRVDNRLIVDIGENSHSISDHTQGNWNGLVGRLELGATPPVWIDDVQVFPDAVARTATVRVRLGNATGKPGRGRLTLLVKPAQRGGATVDAGSDVDREIRSPIAWEADGTTAGFTLRLGEAAPLWDEFNPALFVVAVALQSEFGDHLPTPVRFGLRDLATDGTQFTINGRKLFFRGTLECAIFPRTGHPPTDDAGWRKVIRAAKAHGLNMLRFHSWCPPEAAFRVADELGFYLQVECSSWANQSTSLGDGKPVDAWLYAETDRILEAYGSHPSFVLFLYGNEPGGARHKAWLSEWVSHYRARDPRHLMSGGAGWPQLPEDQFHVTPDPRVQGWGQGLNSRINGRPPETTTDYQDYIQRRNVPVISHEIGQWCVYPNFEETSKYTGYLKARNFEIFYERLVAAGLGSLSRDFLIASGKLQALCYKEDIESALRTPGMGGFQLLDLHDFPGQGTALVGVLDPFWEEKGYIKPAAYRRFCNATVPLARLPKRVFTTAETLEADIEIAHFGPAPIQDAVIEWSLRDGRGRIFRSVQLPSQTVAVGNGRRLCQIRVELHDFPAPAKGNLAVRVLGTDFANDWDLWVYPAETPSTTSEVVWVTSEFDDDAEARLAEGGRVLLTLPAKKVRNFETAPVKLGFSSIFWNTAWTGRQAPTTLGILCDPKHPALEGFPTDFHSNWQW